jgi:hypothetical protein
MLRANGADIEIIDDHPFVVSPSNHVIFIALLSDLTAFVPDATHRGKRTFPVFF